MFAGSKRLAWKASSHSSSRRDEIVGQLLPANELRNHAPPVLGQ